MSRRPLVPERVYHFNIIYNHAWCPLSRTEDTDLAIRVTTGLVERLELRGYVNSYYYDRDHRTKTSFTQELERVLNGSSVTILLVTQGFIRDCLDRYLNISAFKRFMEVPNTNWKLITLSVGVPKEQMPCQLTANQVFYFQEDWEVDISTWSRFDDVVGSKLSGSSEENWPTGVWNNKELANENRIRNFYNTECNQERHRSNGNEKASVSSDLSRIQNFSNKSKMNCDCGQCCNPTPRTLSCMHMSNKTVDFDKQTVDQLNNLTSQCHKKGGSESLRSEFTYSQQTHNLARPEGSQRCPSFGELSRHNSGNIYPYFDERFKFLSSCGQNYDSRAEKLLYSKHSILSTGSSSANTEPILKTSMSILYLPDSTSTATELPLTPVSSRKEETTYLNSSRMKQYNCSLSFKDYCVTSKCGLQTHSTNARRHHTSEHVNTDGEILKELQSDLPEETVYSRCTCAMIGGWVSHCTHDILARENGDKRRYLYTERYKKSDNSRGKNITDTQNTGALTTDNINWRSKSADEKRDVNIGPRKSIDFVGDRSDRKDSVCHVNRTIYGKDVNWVQNDPDSEIFDDLAIRTAANLRKRPTEREKYLPTDRFEILKSHFLDSCSDNCNNTWAPRDRYNWLHGDLKQSEWLNLSQTLINTDNDHRRDTNKSTGSLIGTRKERDLIGSSGVDNAQVDVSKKIVTEYNSDNIPLGNFSNSYTKTGEDKCSVIKDVLESDSANNYFAVLNNQPDTASVFLKTGESNLIPDTFSEIETRTIDATQDKPEPSFSRCSVDTNGECAQNNLDLNQQILNNVSYSNIKDNGITQSSPFAYKLFLITDQESLTEQKTSPSSTFTSQAPDHILMSPCQLEASSNKMDNLKTKELQFLGCLPTQNIMEPNENVLDHTLETSLASSSTIIYGNPDPNSQDGNQTDLVRHVDLTSTLPNHDNVCLNDHLQQTVELGKCVKSEVSFETHETREDNYEKCTHHKIQTAAVLRSCSDNLDDVGNSCATFLINIPESKTVTNSTALTPSAACRQDTHTLTSVSECEYDSATLTVSECEQSSAMFTIMSNSEQNSALLPSKSVCDNGSEKAQNNIFPYSGIECAQNNIVPTLNSEYTHNNNVSTFDSERIRDSLTTSLSSKCTQDNIVPASDSECTQDNTVPKSDSECTQDNAVPKTDSECTQENAVPTSDIECTHDNTVPASDSECTQINTVPTSDSECTQDNTVPTSHSECKQENTVPKSDSKCTQDNIVPTSDSECIQDNTVPTSDSDRTRDNTVPISESECTQDNTVPTADSECKQDNTVPTSDSECTQDYGISTLDTERTQDNTVPTSDSECTQDYGISTLDCERTQYNTVPTSDSECTQDNTVPTSDSECTQDNTVPTSDSECTQDNTVPTSGSECTQDNTVPTSDSECTQYNTVPTSDSECTQDNTVPTSDSECTQDNTVPTSDSECTQDNTVPTSDSECTQDNTVPTSDSECTQDNTVPTSDSECTQYNTVPTSDSECTQDNTVPTSDSECTQDNTVPTSDSECTQDNTVPTSDSECTQDNTVPTSDSECTQDNTVPTSDSECTQDNTVPTSDSECTQDNTVPTSDSECTQDNTVPTSDSDRTRDNTVPISESECTQDNTVPTADSECKQDNTVPTSDSECTQDYGISTLDCERTQDDAVPTSDSECTQDNTVPTSDSECTRDNAVPTSDSERTQYNTVPTSDSECTQDNTVPISDSESTQVNTTPTSDRDCTRDNTVTKSDSECTQNSIVWTSDSECVYDNNVLSPDSDCTQNSVVPASDREDAPENTVPISDSEWTQNSTASTSDSKYICDSFDPLSESECQQDNTIRTLFLECREEKALSDAVSKLKENDIDKTNIISVGRDDNVYLTCSRSIGTLLSENMQETGISDTPGVQVLTLKDISATEGVNNWPSVKNADQLVYPYKEAKYATQTCENAVSQLSEHIHADDVDYRMLQNAPNNTTCILPFKESSSYMLTSFRMNTEGDSGYFEKNESLPQVEDASRQFVNQTLEDVCKQYVFEQVQESHPQVDIASQQFVNQAYEDVATNSFVAQTQESHPQVEHASRQFVNQAFEDVITQSVFEQAINDRDDYMFNVHSELIVTCAVGTSNNNECDLILSDHLSKQDCFQEVFEATKDDDRFSATLEDCVIAQDDTSGTHLFTTDDTILSDSIGFLGKEIFASVGQSPEQITGSDMTSDDVDNTDNSTGHINTHSDCRKILTADSSQYHVNVPVEALDKTEECPLRNVSNQVTETNSTPKMEQFLSATDVKDSHVELKTVKMTPETVKNSAFILLENDACNSKYLSSGVCATRTYQDIDTQEKCSNICDKGIHDENTFLSLPSTNVTIGPIETLGVIYDRIYITSEIDEEVPNITSETCSEHNQVPETAPVLMLVKQSGIDEDESPEMELTGMVNATESEEVDWKVPVFKGVCHVLSTPDMPYLG